VRLKGLTLVAVLVTTGAFAEPSAAVKKYLGGAAALFENLEYEKALTQLGRAKAKSQGPEDDAAIALYEGTVLAEMGDPRASSLFVLALGIEPDAQLPFVVSPKVQQVFDKAKASVSKLVKPKPAPEPEPPKEAPPPKETPPPAQPPPPALQPAPPPTPPPAVSAARPSAQSSGIVRKLSFVPGVLGVGAAVTGVVLRLLADSVHTSLVTGAPMSPDDARNQVSTGKLYQTVGFLLIGIGAAAIAAAVAMFIGGGASD
jgi:hypothetical protein